MRDGALWITKVDGDVTSSATKIYLARRWLPTAMVRPAEGGGETEWGSISSFHPPHPHHLMQGTWTQVRMMCAAEGVAAHGLPLDLLVWLTMDTLSMG